MLVVEVPQRREIEMVVMIMTNQHDIDGGQIFQLYARRRDSPWACECNRAGAGRVLPFPGHSGQVSN